MSFPQTGISVSIIARNEAHNIRRCLESVRALAEEIVIVVNNCTDGTDEIAREEFGAKVYEKPWTGFGDQKNNSLDAATCPWILCLDCDEVVTPELAAEILNFVQSDPSGYAGAMFPRKVWFLGRWITHGDWYPDHSLRLIRKGKGRWSPDIIHEKMLLDGKAKLLRADLEHYSNPDLNSHLSKIVPFTDSFVEQKRHKPWRLLDVLFRPWWRFFRAYVLKRGFLDGFPGFYIAAFTAFSTFYRYARLYEDKQTQETSKP